MTIGAATFFAILLALAVQAARWITRNQQWRLVITSFTVLVALTALVDGGLARWIAYRDTQTAKPEPARVARSAAEVYAGLLEGRPRDAGHGGWERSRWQPIGVAEADTSAVVIPGASQPVSRVRPGWDCAAQGLGDIPGLGIKDARSDIAGALGLSPCWVPWSQTFSR
jgi:hypothetical protein